jgi:hypothetical protein
VNQRYLCGPACQGVARCGVKVSFSNIASGSRIDCSSSLLRELLGAPARRSHGRLEAEGGRRSVRAPRGAIIGSDGCGHRHSIVILDLGTVQMMQMKGADAQPMQHQCSDVRLVGTLTYDAHQTCGGQLNGGWGAGGDVLHCADLTVLV